MTEAATPTVPTAVDALRIHSCDRPRLSIAFRVRAHRWHRVASLAVTAAALQGAFSSAPHPTVWSVSTVTPALPNFARN